MIIIGRIYNYILLIFDFVFFINKKEEQYGMNDEIEIYNDLKKKVENLEYKEIKSLKEEITDIKIELSNNSLLTQQAIDTSRKLSDTMENVKEAMIKISDSITTTNKISNDLASNVDDLANKVNRLDEKVENRLDDIESKSKFDILEWLKNNFVTIIMAIGVFMYLYSKGF